MKIDSCTMMMSSQRTYRALGGSMRRLSGPNDRAGFSGNKDTLAQNFANGNAAGKSGVSKDAFWENLQNRFQMQDRRIASSSEREANFQVREILLQYLFDMLFTSRRNLPDFQGPTLQYTEEVWHMESEDTSFSTVGTVRTADGREIHFNVNVEMSREFQEYYREDFVLAPTNLCDPLVINLDTDAAQLSDQTFFFDIDADGVKDEISMLGSGSGFLALDKNGDGKINDGSELFGTASGDGFRDLAKYDEDGNGWIDENDSVWSKLQIWCKDDKGRDVLYRLEDKGIGAICLQNVSTDFALKGENNQTNGLIRKTGIFLYENGAVGSVQHVDLAKYAGQA